MIFSYKKNKFGRFFCPTLGKLSSEIKTSKNQMTFQTHFISENKDNQINTIFQVKLRS